VIVPNREMHDPSARTAVAANRSYQPRRRGALWRTIRGVDPDGVPRARVSVERDIRWGPPSLAPSLGRGSPFGQTIGDHAPPHLRGDFPSGSPLPLDTAPRGPPRAAPCTRGGGNAVHPTAHAIATMTMTCETNMFHAVRKIVIPRQTEWRPWRLSRWKGRSFSLRCPS
jgi:hypothetical protein